MREKIIRDPVHDIIAFRTDRPLERLLFSLLNAGEFQRLRRIRQLGMASLAYPGADHSRYSHSLGVMETARKILHRLAEFHTIDKEAWTLCLVSALLHDLGHGPFSHVFERVTDVHHEALTQRVINDPESEVHQILSAFDPSLPARIVGCIGCEEGRTFVSDILCSQLDADRFDYLLRDNLMTGSGYGSFDLRWVLQGLTIDEPTNRLAVSIKGISAVEGYLQSRFHMYRNVYFHKVVRSAEGMVKLALQRAKRLAVQGRLDWPPHGQYVQKALLGQQLTMDEFRNLDDIAVLDCFKIWSKNPDAILARLCNGLLFRRLFKSIDLTRISDDPARIPHILAEVEGAITAAGGEPAYEMFYDSPSDTPYEAYDPTDPSSAKEIMIRTADGDLREFAALSPLVQALNRQMAFQRLHFSEEYRPAVLKAVGG
ncbi:MAG TPA: HD domain-containing protein [Tepidisphaeraceae bacterium]|jgi:hypothetical protein|nr:HD domain-containing protein [Tepidisphaeraceae bacterium]